MAILNGIMGPGLAGVLTEMNSVVEFVSRQLSLPPPVMKIVSSDNLKDDSLNFELRKEKVVSHYGRRGKCTKNACFHYS